MKLSIGIILTLTIIGSTYSQSSKITSNCESPFKLYITPVQGTKAVNNNPVEETTYCSTEFNFASLSSKGSCCNKDLINSFHQKNMDTLKKEMTNFVAQVGNIKVAFEKSGSDEKLKTKLTNLYQWAKAELAKKTKGKSDTGDDTDYKNKFIAEEEGVYQNLNNFLYNAITNNLYKKEFMTNLIASLKSKGQTCLTNWDTFLKKSFCLLCSPRVNSFFTSNELKIYDTEAKSLLQNCGEFWHYTSQLTLMSKAIAYLMKAHSLKDKYDTSYLNQEPKASFDLTLFDTPLKELVGATKDNIDTKFTSFKTKNGYVNFINIFLYWNKWNPLLWGNSLDLKYASQIFNSADPKPKEKRLLAGTPKYGHQEHHENRVLELEKASGKFKQASNVTVKYDTLKGLTVTTDVTVNFDKTGESNSFTKVLAPMMASVIAVFLILLY